MIKILVTGNKGFIGQNLVSYLNLNNNAFKVARFDAEYFESDDWQSILKSYLVSANPDFIFHVGACSDTLEKNVDYMMIRNFESTKIISDYCLFKKIPLCYSSSAACYGIDNLVPSNLYGWSKYVAEQYVIKNGGIALRYFNVYGPHEEHKGKMSSVAYQSHVKHKNKEKVLLFPKVPKRDFVYINDVIGANMYVFHNFENLTKTYYDVGTGTPRSFEDVLNILGIPFDYFDESYIPDGYQFYTCSNKEKWLPFWRSRWTLEEGLTEYKKYLYGENFNNWGKM